MQAFVSVLMCGGFVACNTAAQDNSGASMTSTGEASTGVLSGSTSGQPVSPTSGGTTHAVGGSSESDTGTVFVSDELPDLPPACDVYTQDCPKGEKCNPWSPDGSSVQDETRCVPLVDDPGAPGEACSFIGEFYSGFDTCDETSMCHGVNAEGEGTCVRHCEGSPSDPTCPEAWTQCRVGAGISVCLSFCNPLVPESCTAEEACVLMSDVNYDCVPTAELEGRELFENCESHISCSPGLACILSEAVGDDCSQDDAFCCSPHCDLSAPACPPSMECAPVYRRGATPPGFENVGLCIGAL